MADRDNPGLSRRGPAVPESVELGAALEHQDSAAVAFALRHGHVVVPLLSIDGPAQVRVFRASAEDPSTLLLFSSAQNYVRMLPREADLRVLSYDRAQLVDFLEKHLGEIGTVWFDVAGPFPMQAAAAELLTALTLPLE